MSDERAQTESIETDEVAVSTLTMDDLDEVVRIDGAHVGRTRREFLGKRMETALRDSGLAVALKAEVDGAMAGFLLGEVHYGEFGQMEPIAVMDVIGVHPHFEGKHVGAALMRQLEMQLRALGIETLQTEVNWSQLELLAFLQNRGFGPSARICLEKPLA